MAKEKIAAKVLVFGNEIDRCPECAHEWTDFGDCHYHDCRYFSLEQEGESESDDSVQKISFVESPFDLPIV